MQFNKEKFFTKFRTFYKQKTGKTRLTANVVDDVSFLLDEFAKYPQWSKVEHIAYAFATIAHETAWTFKPIKEYRGKTLSRQQQKYWNTGYYGRGYVQLTWDYNYKKAGQKLKVNLLNNPDLALDPDIAFQILTYGMHEGWFTGKKLLTYINNTKEDYTNARRIINGTDKASLIAGYASSFEAMLRTSIETDTKPTIEEEKPIEEPTEENRENLDSTIDEYPENPKPGEPTTDTPALPDTPVVGGRPTDEPITVEPVATDKPSGLSAWVASVRGWWASLGLGGFSLAGLGASSWLANPMFIKIFLGTLGLAIVIGLIIWLTYMIVRAYHLRQREKEAFELTKLEMQIKADPSKYNVTVPKSLAHTGEN